MREKLEGLIISRMGEIKQDTTEQNKEYLRGYTSALKWVLGLFPDRGTR